MSRSSQPGAEKSAPNNPTTCQSKDCGKPAHHYWEIKHFKLGMLAHGWYCAEHFVQVIDHHVNWPYTDTRMTMTVVRDI